MEGQQNIILELNRINSIRVKSSGEDVDNKASWVNKTAPVVLRRGDSINLENAIINIAGADTSSIQFNGDGATNTNPIQDNFMMMNIGFYINDNRLNNCTLPLFFNTEEHVYSHLAVDDNKVEGGGTPATQTINNNYGFYYNYQYLSTPNEGDPNPFNKGIERLESVRSINRFNTFKGEKFAKVHPDYAGWTRGNNPTRQGINNILTIGETDMSKVDLMTEDIPLSVSAGFISPNSLADELTLIMNQTRPFYRDDGKTLYKPVANTKKDGVPDNKLLNQYHFNGYAYKTINANLQRQDDTQHYIYGNLFVKEPYKWKYGTRLIKNTDIYNLIEDSWIDPTLDNYTNYRIEYPVFLWSRFIGQNAQPQDRFNFQDYSIYSPSSSTIISGHDYDDFIVESTGLSQSFSDMNDVFISVFKNTTNGCYLCKKDGDFVIVRNSGNTSMVINEDGSDRPATLLLDNDNDGYSDIIAYNRFYVLQDTWNSDEHQEIKTVAYDDFFTSYLSIPSDAIDTGYFEKIQPEADYTPRSFVAINPSGGTSGLKYIYDWLEDNTTGIIAGATYILSFTTKYVGIDPNDGASSTQYAHAIGVADRSQYGMNAMSVTADGTYTQTWTATQSFSGNNFLMFSLNHGVPYEQQVAVTNISLLRTHLNQDETFEVQDYWTGDVLGGGSVVDNKIYRIKQNTSLQSNEVTVSNNTAPNQGAYTGVDFNRKYKILDRGFMFVFDNQLNKWKVSTGLTGNNSQNASVLYNNDDPDYTYWIYQKYGSVNWFMNRYTKYYGDTTLLNNDVIGDAQGIEVNLKNRFRIGQQYYKLHNVTWSDTNKPIYDYSSGNDWTNATPGGYASLRFFDTSGNAGGNIGYYDGYWTNPLNLAQRVYYRYNPQGDNTKISGTAYYPPSDPAPYWERQWSFDINTGGNGTFTQIYTDGSQATYTPSVALSVSYPNIVFTNNITNPLPNLPAPLDTTKTYFSTFDFNGVTYYMSNNDSNPTDNQLNGFGGKVYYVDGGNQEEEWTLNNYIITMPTSSFTFSGVGGGSLILSTVVTASTTNTITFGGLSYDVPKDGKGYGYDYSTFGTTAYNLTSHDYLYLGFNNDVGGGESNPSSRIVNKGKCFDNIGDFFANDNGKTWSLDWGNNGLNTLKIEDANGQELFSLTQDHYKGLNFGWCLVRTDRIIPSNIETGFTINNIVNDRFAFLNDTLDTTTGNTNYVIYTLNTNSTTGITYDLKSRTQEATIDSGTFKSFADSYADKSKANIPKHTLLFTNIVFNEKNLAIIKDYFRYNEIANSTSETRDDIIKDKNWYVSFDIGRADDGDVDTDNSHTDWTTNTSNRKPLIPQYMYDKGIMGQDDTNIANDTINRGCTFPTIRHLNVSDANPPVKSYDDTAEEPYQKINCFTKYQGDNWDERVIQTNRNAVGDIDGAIYLYNRGMTFQKFKEQYNDLYKYIVDNDINVIPIIREDGTLLCSFEVSEDYTNGELYTIQNYTYFGFSPSAFDNPNCVGINNDAPAIDPNHYAWSKYARGQANYLNIGAISPAVNYNNNVGKFTFSDFHTPVKFNANLTTSTEEIGESVALFFTNKTDFYNEFTHPLQDQKERHLGVADCQSGIFINDVYFQINGNTNIVSHTDDRAIQMTPSNYYNSMPFRLGFSFYDLKPMNLAPFLWDNRFYNLYYNSLINQYKNFGLRPFTTNPLITNTVALNANVFTDNSGTDTTINPNSGQPRYQLGYNNNLPFSVLIDTSDELFSRSKPVNISSGYYRIYVDLPLDSLEYQDGTGSNLSCIGYALLNYASSQQYFYSYATSFGTTLTKDMVLNQVRVEIRDEIGRVVKGLGTKCSVIIKVNRPFTFGIPEEDPEEEENDLLKKIEGKLDDIDDTLETENFEGELEDIKVKQSVKSDSKESVALPVDVDKENRINEFIREIENAMIQTITNNILLPPALLEVRRKEGKVNRPRLTKQIIRNLGNGIAEYMLRNKPKLQGIKRLALSQGLNKMKQSEDFLEIVDELKNFFINSRGELMEGASETSDDGLVQISPEGAEFLAEKINKELTLNPNIDKDKLQITINGDIGRMLMDTNDIKLNVPTKSTILTELQKKQIEEQILKKPFSKFKEDVLGLKPTSSSPKRVARQLDQAYKYAQEAYERGDIDAGYTYLRAIVNRLRDLGEKVPPVEALRNFGRGGLPLSVKTGRKERREEGKKNLKEIEEALRALSPKRTPKPVGAEMDTLAEFASAFDMSTGKLTPKGGASKESSKPKLTKRAMSIVEKLRKGSVVSKKQMKESIAEAKKESEK
jgi:hypothetical protein